MMIGWFSSFLRSPDKKQEKQGGRLSVKSDKIATVSEKISLNGRDRRHPVTGLPVNAMLS